MSRKLELFWQLEMSETNLATECFTYPRTLGTSSFHFNPLKSLLWTSKWTIFIIQAPISVFLNNWVSFARKQLQLLPFPRQGGSRGGSRIFFRRCTRLLLYFNANKPHGFFLHNTSYIRKPQVISEGRGGGAVRTPCTLLLDPPLGSVRFHRGFKLPSSLVRIGILHMWRCHCFGHFKLI